MRTSSHVSRTAPSAGATRQPGFVQRIRPKQSRKTWPTTQTAAALPPVKGPPLPNTTPPPPPPPPTHRPQLTGHVVCNVVVHDEAQQAVEQGEVHLLPQLLHGGLYRQKGRGPGAGAQPEQPHMSSTQSGEHAPRCSLETAARARAQLPAARQRQGAGPPGGPAHTQAHPFPRAAQRASKPTCIMTTHSPADVSHTSVRLLMPWHHL